MSSFPLCDHVVSHHKMPGKHLQDTGCICSVVCVWALAGALSSCVATHVGVIRHSHHRPGWLYMPLPSRLAALTHVPAGRLPQLGPHQQWQGERCRQPAWPARPLMCVCTVVSKEETTLWILHTIIFCWEATCAIGEMTSKRLACIWTLGLRTDLRR